MDQALARIIGDSARRVVALKYPAEAAEFELVLPALLQSLQLDTRRTQQPERVPAGLALTDVALARDHSALTVFIVAELVHAAAHSACGELERLDRTARALSRSILDRDLVECAKTAVAVAMMGHAHE